MPTHSGPMACPVDGNTLVMSERSGIEIDYCPQCRGVWLDRGELDKIIERNAESAPAAAAPPVQQQVPWGHEPRGQYGHQKPYRKKRSFLEDLFD